jgi:polyisoprenoid-binding protein YceI
MRLQGTGRRRYLPVVIVVGLLLAGAGLYLVYDQFLRGDNRAPLALSTGTPGATGSAAGTSSPSGTAGPTQGSGGGAADVVGTWQVAEGSEAGYRVRERLANLSADSDAVGRTSDVTGEVTLAASGDALQVTAARFAVDLTTLRSDEERRDRRLTSMAIESGRFPTSTFELSGPVDVPAAALSGSDVDVTLPGKLTLHGVTRDVQIPAKARLSGEQIEIAGSLTFPFADFEIVPPDIAGFVTVEPQGTLEFLVRLTKAG